MNLYLGICRRFKILTIDIHFTFWKKKGPVRADEPGAVEGEADQVGGRAAAGDRRAAVGAVAQPGRHPVRRGVVHERLGAGPQRAQVVEREQQHGGAHLGADPLPLVRHPQPGPGPDLPGDPEVDRRDALHADHPPVDAHQEVHRPPLRGQLARAATRSTAGSRGPDRPGRRRSTGS